MKWRDLCELHFFFLSNSRMINDRKRYCRSFPPTAVRVSKYHHSYLYVVVRESQEPKKKRKEKKWSQNCLFKSRIPPPVWFIYFRFIYTIYQIISYRVVGRTDRSPRITQNLYARHELLSCARRTKNYYLYYNNNVMTYLLYVCIYYDSLTSCEQFRCQPKTCYNNNMLAVNSKIGRENIIIW